MKRKWFSLWTQIFFCIGLACGVNTGNPGGKNRPTLPTDPTPSTSVSLSLRELAEGVVSFRASELIFLSKGAKLSDSTQLTIALPESREISTGTNSTLLKSYALQEGTYDRLIVTIDAEAGVSLTDTNQKQERIGLAPFSYYPDSTIEDTSGKIRLLFDLSQTPLIIEAGKVQSVVLRSDFKTNFKPYSNISPQTKAYFEALGQTSLRYTLSPETPARPIVTEIPKGQPESEASLEFNLEATFASNDPDLESVEICVYQGKLTQAQLAEDFCASEYYDYEVVEAERAEESGPGSFKSSFLVEPGEYTIAVFRDSPEYGLLHFQAVELVANQLKTLERIQLPLEPLVIQE